MRTFIGKPIGPTATGGNRPSRAGQCQNDGDRDVVERIDYRLTVTSARAIDNLTLIEATRTSIGSARPTYYGTDASRVGDDGRGAQTCSSEGARQVTHDFGTVRHNQTVTLTVWALFVGSVTPNQPNPTLTDLARHYTIDIARVRGLALGLEPWGPRVMSCDQIAGELISVASRVPATISTTHGPAICHPNP